MDHVAIFKLLELFLNVRLHIFIFLFFPIPAFTQGIPPIGEWREHLPYNSAIDLAAGEGKIFCATPYSLFSVDLDDLEIERISRVTGLSETGVSAICYDEINKKLLVAYTNSNIDIIHRKNINNIPGIKQSTVPGNKTIYKIHSRGNFYYLSTGLGVIVIDAERYEVKETWYLGTAGNQLKVNDLTSDALYYYAATDDGLMRIPVSAPDPSNAAAWEMLGGTNGLSPGQVRHVINAQNKIIAEKNDSLFIFDGNNWALFYSGGMPVMNVNSSDGKIVVNERSTAGPGRITFLGSDGSVFRVLSNTGAVSFPRKAILVNNEPWVADQFAGLSHIFSSGSYDNFIPNSPQSVSGGEMIVQERTLYATAGAVNSSWNYQYNGEGIFVFKEGQWNNINRYRFPVLDSMLDFITITPDPRDGSFWAGSFGGGLAHVKPGPQFQVYKQNVLGAAIGDPSSYRVAGISFDKDKNLWVSNFGSSQPLRVMKQDGSWKNFTIPFALFERALSQIIIDENNFKWIVSPLGNGLIAFDHGAGIDDISDDQWRRFTTGTGNGNLPSSEVLSIAKDKNGFIWVGTMDGIGVIECGAEVFSSAACDAIWPVVPNGNFSGYLFKGQEVRSIAVDGANRKWVATNHGVFLVSPEGEKLIYRFSEDNSPLLSNDVSRIAIDGKTGEVFFATLKGLCSFRSTATEGGEENLTPLTIFPNPVPPGYTGTIAIRGLIDNAIVRITELDGRLVHQTRALGGQATWDGRNYRGQRISSGAYLVLVADDRGKENVAGRIFFIR